MGTWNTDPVKLRREFGTDLRMFGGVNKHVIPLGEKSIRDHLKPLVPLVEEGGHIPIPDHRIPPDCSPEQFRIYVKVFKEVLNITSTAGGTAGLQGKDSGQIQRGVQEASLGLIGALPASSTPAPTQGCTG